MARQGDRGGGRELSVVGGVVIRPDWSLWLLLGLGIVLLAALGLFSGAQALAADGHSPVLAALGALGGLGGAALLLTGLLRWATIFYPDRIDRRGLFAVRDLRKADIAGYRRIKPRNGPAYLKLSSKAPGVKPLAVYIFSNPAAFDQWLVGIPDLDAADLAAATQALMANPMLGPIPFNAKPAWLS